MPTILITGCSSGFGLATARLFVERGWHVIATVRSAESGVPIASEALRVLPLDVTDTARIAEAVSAAGMIDVLVNNAGIGFLNALEGTPMEVARTLFDTNVLGPLAMMQAVVPQMRERGAGTIVNVGSSATYDLQPLLSVYTASKAAITALSDGAALELGPLGVRVRVVVPGRAPTTGFNDNARKLMTAGFPDAYAGLVHDIFARWERQGAAAITSAENVAEAVWQAATDPHAPPHIAAGADARALMRVA